jgi:hypothetical protein
MVQQTRHLLSPLGGSADELVCNKSGVATRGLSLYLPGGNVSVRDRATKLRASEPVGEGVD